MNEKNINWIVSATEDRLSYSHIQFSESMRNELIKTVSDFSDDDFKNVTDGLTNSIYNKLLEFGVPDITAYRCSWKWSD